MDINSLFEEDQLQLVKITKSFENLINQTETIELEKGINTFGFGFPLLIRRDQTDNKLTVAPMGIHVSRDSDQQLYYDIDTEAKRLIRISEEIKVSVEKIIQTDNGRSEKTKGFKVQLKGHCIRCNAPINLNPLAPYCKDCFNIWNKYGDELYQEKYCHICGKSEKTSKIKPACSTCYKENKYKLEFPI